MSVPTDLRTAVRTVMEAHWRPEGFTVPSADRYPWQWLWDSCFHALVWLELGDADRAVTELTSALVDQDDDGFVPHIRYVGAPSPHAAFWKRATTSSITQPPMYGHAIASLVEAGVDVPAALVARAGSGLRFLFRRRHPSGLVAVAHPWETGCDDSPRFDHWGAADPKRWYDVKGALVATSDFDCAPAGFNALVAWNARRLATVTGDLRAEADEVAGALANQWDEGLRTWVDAGAAAHTSGRCRTADALLATLVVDDHGVLADDAWSGAFGVPGVHRDEPAYEPTRYWRGGVWAPLAYLLWRASHSAVDSPGTAIAKSTVRGAVISGFAEWWDADDGSGFGAVPQSWSGLALLMADAA